MESSQPAAQLLEVIAGRYAQVPIGHGVINHLESSEQPGFEIGRDVAGTDIIHEEGPQPGIPKASDHRFTPAMDVCTTL